MQKAIRLPYFLWSRGERSLWRVAGPPFALEYTARWPDLDSPSARPYAPLGDLDLLPDLAEVGRAVTLAEAPHVGPVTVVFGPTTTTFGSPTQAQRSAAGAAADPGIHRGVLTFVRKHGPLHLPHRNAPAQPLFDFLVEAVELYEAQCLVGGRPAPFSEPSAVRSAFIEHLSDVNLTLIDPSAVGREADGPTAVGVPATTCGDLLTAAWLSLYNGMGTGQPWLSCKGCSRLFMQRRRGQEYHDKACRNRANVRRSTQKRRGAGT